MLFYNPNVDSNSNPNEVEQFGLIFGFNSKPVNLVTCPSLVEVLFELKTFLDS